jgi:hypothetical protein
MMYVIKNCYFSVENTAFANCEFVGDGNVFNANVQTIDLGPLSESHSCVMVIPPTSPPCPTEVFTASDPRELLRPSQTFSASREFSVSKEMGRVMHVLRRRERFPKRRNRGAKQ